MTFGDAFSFTMLVLLTASSLWASLLACMLLFPRRSQRASHLLIHQLRRSMIVGSIASVAGIGLGIAMMNAPAAGVKILGIVLLGLTAFTAIVGCSGLVELASVRAGLDRNNSPLSARGKAAGLLISAGLLPGIGWFLLFPLQLFAGVGTGLAVVFQKTPPDVTPQENP